MLAIVVPGTWSRDAGWHQPGAAWPAFMETQGVTLYRGADGRGPAWSGDMNGRPWRRWIGREDHGDWITGGIALYAWVVPPIAPHCRIAPEDTRIICHSHGLQVVLYACQLGLRVRSLVSIGSPVRADMRAVSVAARRNIGAWLHLHSDWSDRWQWLGAVGDGALGIQRRHPLADLNRALPGVGHSRILTDPKAFGIWPEVVDWLRAA